jgi:hypothetical protein
MLDGKSAASPMNLAQCVIIATLCARGRGVACVDQQAGVKRLKIKAF